MKPTRHGAQLVIADLVRITGLTFTHPDRLTRAEANQVRDWAKDQPLVRRVITDRTHPEHASLRYFMEHVDHFAFHHPQDATGAPSAWSQGRLLDLNAPIKDMTAEEAEARLTWARTTPEYRDAYLNPAHPDHGIYVQQTAALTERAMGAGSDQVAASPAAVAGPTVEPSADALATIRQLEADPAYRDARHPSHSHVKEAMTAAYKAAYPEPGAPAAASPAGAVQPSPQDRMRAVREHPAYMDGRHPEHAAQVAEMTAAFEAAYPAEAPATPEAGA